MPLDTNSKLASIPTFRVAKSSAPRIESSALVDETLISKLLDRLNAAVWIFDFDHKRFLWGNHEALKLLNAENLQELRDRDLSADMSPAIDTRLRQYQQDFQGQHQQDCHESNLSFSETWTLYPKGVATPVHLIMSGIKLVDGRMALLCEARPRLEIRADTLRASEAVMHTTVMISLFTEDGYPLYRNTAARAACFKTDARFEEQFCHGEDGTRLLDELRRLGRARSVSQIKNTTGTDWHEISISQCHDAVTGEKAFLVSEIDVTELHETKERAQFLASHDSLTGLSTRTYLQEELTRLLTKAKKHNRRASIYLVDLDNPPMSA